MARRVSTCDGRNCVDLRLTQLQVDIGRDYSGYWQLDVVFLAAGHGGARA